VLECPLDRLTGERAAFAFLDAERLQVSDGAIVRRFPVLQQPVGGNRKVA
jgi:hypothetical protein